MAVIASEAKQSRPQDYVSPLDLVQDCHAALAMAERDPVAREHRKRSKAVELIDMAACLSADRRSGWHSRTAIPMLPLEEG